MTLHSWQQLIKLKANLVELAGVLQDDDVISREEIALDLLLYIEYSNEIEDDVIKIIRNTRVRDLHKKCEKIELDREKKRTL